MTDTTPKATLAQLDRYIVGQVDAKRALAIALRERDRRLKLEEPMRSEIGPKNILLIGPTGVGKTEIVKRLAKMVDAPFLKVEATKFTEVGYVGHDVESIVRDLADASVNAVHQERTTEVQDDADKAALDRLVGYLMKSENQKPPDEGAKVEAGQKTGARRRRSSVARMLKNRELEEHVIEIEVENEDGFSSVLEFVSGMGSDEVTEQFHEFMHSLSASRQRVRRVPVREARRILSQEEANKLIDFDRVVDDAIGRVEESGIVFIDEIDKLVTRGGDYGPDVSGEGVQRDLLPIVEGASVATRYGMVKTDHILFVGAGAFNRARPADLLPELQGRFPLRVEFQSLDQADFVRILTEPENALVKQYAALMKTEGVDLQFTTDGVEEVARVAHNLNEQTENLGARRLYGVVEKVLEEVSFDASEHSGETVVVDATYVTGRMEALSRTDDRSRFIL
ncbi:MAG TPA: ATP-dependent protease ATPase subunit HslU [Chloroflexota bacterium]|jgi:ATP-dependent HslUV protease ATP-binding subunit HslU|nr:ATP-dependent protease ATPase subunit HslU [Chloroflexota bacterium]